MIGGTYCVTPLLGTGEPGHRDGDVCGCAFKRPTVVVHEPYRHSFIILDQLSPQCLRLVTSDGYIDTLRWGGELALSQPASACLHNDSLIISNTGCNSLCYLSIASFPIHSPGSKTRKVYSDPLDIKTLSLEGLESPHGVIAYDTASLLVADTGNGIIKRVTLQDIRDDNDCNQQLCVRAVEILAPRAFIRPAHLALLFGNACLCVSDDTSISLLILKTQRVIRVCFVQKKIPFSPISGLASFSISDVQEAVFFSCREANSLYVFNVYSSVLSDPVDEVTASLLTFCDGTGLSGNYNSELSVSRFNEPTGLATVSLTGSPAVILCDTGNSLLKLVALSSELKIVFPRSTRHDGQSTHASSPALFQLLQARLRENDTSDRIVAHVQSLEDCRRLRRRHVEHDIFQILAERSLISPHISQGRSASLPTRPPFSRRNLPLPLNSTADDYMAERRRLIAEDLLRISIIQDHRTPHPSAEFTPSNPNTFQLLRSETRVTTTRAERTNTGSKREYSDPGLVNTLTQAFTQTAHPYLTTAFVKYMKETNIAAVHRLAEHLVETIGALDIDLCDSLLQLSLHSIGKFSDIRLYLQHHARSPTNSVISEHIKGLLLLQELLLLHLKRFSPHILGIQQAKLTITTPGEFTLALGFSSRAKAVALLQIYADSRRLMLSQPDTSIFPYEELRTAKRIDGQPGAFLLGDKQVQEAHALSLALEVCFLGKEFSGTAAAYCILAGRAVLASGTVQLTGLHGLVTHRLFANTKIPASRLSALASIPCQSRQLIDDVPLTCRISCQSITLHLPFGLSTRRQSSKPPTNESSLECFRRETLIVYR
ncbi:hypothetical protein GMRT_11838 [Giardia muris]|uniref:Uncharacterized protein n=1 Tax=Giardia muris TaxID=5742 RepID=A0A4Z1SZV3_GIAMU|nr:hypothetical protein GMRT_11838 [Giardia muris]|eukprot:TNJ28988.1 hypothetical protein GMRT_11838 [Giardia muris]